MDKIGFKDVIDLALKGYKPGDIREIIEIAKEASESGQNTDELPEARGEDKKADDPDPEDVSEDKKDEPEKTSETEQLRAEIISLQDKIRQMQSDNIKKEVAGDEKTSEQKFEDFVNDFLSGGKTT